METKYKKTKDVVTMTGLSRETLKFYESKGLIKPAGRTTGGYRLYSDACVQQLNFIRAAQDVGFSLKEILELLSLGTRQKVDSTALKNIAQTKIQSLDDKILKLKGMRDLLETYIVDPQSWEDDPECASLLAVISSPA